MVGPLANETKRRNNPRVFLYLSLAVVAGFTVIDLERTPDMMIGYFFIIPVIMSYFTERARYVYLVAFVSSLASLSSLLLAPAGVTPNIALNRPFSLVVVWVVALLGDYQIRSNQRLSDERNRLRAILDTLPVGVAISDAKGRLEEANAQMDTVWGGKFTIARHPTEFLSYVGYWPSTGKRLTLEEWPMARSVNQSETVAGETVEIERANGTRATLLISSAPIRDRDGHIAGAVTVAMDITVQKGIERELAQKAEDLFRSNRELQQFAYVASHDLKEPLRMVTTYVQLLDRRYGERLDGEAKEYIGYAVEGSKRMYMLVEDLLTYSRVETSTLPFGPVSMDDVMATTLRDLGAALESSRAVVNVEPLPEVHADRQQMVQLMENLVGNAIKFRREEAPVVHVSATAAGDEIVFSVRDNGIGIAKEYGEKVFQMFQRLHPRETFPGTGIGLAICKKVVERHGGRIWFESEPGVGTTFYFTLPVKTV
jgi:signal transduction histidine kinase